MRRAAVTVSIKGHDVTLDLMPYLVSLTYTDKADEELDDLQIVLEDREGIWQGDWLPQTGDVIEASILTENWRLLPAPPTYYTRYAITYNGEVIRQDSKTARVYTVTRVVLDELLKCGTSQ